MKYLFLLICISLLSLNSIAQHRSKLDSANINGDKFLGTWNRWSGIHNKDVSDCVIRRRGSEYTLQYVNIPRGGGSQIRAFFYKLKGDSLVGEDKSYGNIIFIPKTRHIKWKEGEWEKTITNKIGGAPDKK
jgi:hypothetical protein